MRNRIAAWLRAAAERLSPSRPARTVKVRIEADTSAFTESMAELAANARKYGI